MNTNVSFYNSETDTMLSFDYLDDLNSDYRLHPRRYHFLVRLHNIKNKQAFMREVAVAAYQYELAHCLRSEEDLFIESILEPRLIELLDEEYYATKKV